MNRIVVIAGILGLAVVSAVAMVSLREEPPKKERVDIDPLVETLRLASMTANFEVHSQGTVLPRTETVLSAEIAGTIVSISPKFVAGGIFQKDETLMRVDPTNYTVAVTQAEALVKQRQIEYDGASKLRSQGYRAESEFASAAAVLASAKAELVRARRNLQRTYIRVPYDGIVRAKETDLGQFVNTGTRVGVVFATDFAEVRLPLTDTDLAFLDLPGANEIADPDNTAGPLVKLTATQKGEAVEWQARIVRTEGVVDEKSRVTYGVAEISDPYGLQNNHRALPVGTFVGAVIQGSTADNIIRVPRGALRKTNQLLFVNNDDTIAIREVVVARTDSEYAYLRDGAVAGERIVTSALEAPIDGMSIRTTDDSAVTKNVIASDIEKN